MSKTYRKIAMYDFDGTLFKSWEATPFWWEGSELDKGAYSFFVRPESLDEPCVPKNPSSAYWINKTLKAAQADSSNRNVFVVVVTGRVKVHKKRVLSLLASKGIRPEASYFNPGMSAATFKIAVLRNLIVGLNIVDQVDIWENENQTAYQNALEQAGSILGRDIKVTVHSVHEQPVPLECGPKDFGLREKSAKRVASVYSERIKSADGGIRSSPQSRRKS